MRTSPLYEVLNYQAFNFGNEFDKLSQSCGQDLYVCNSYFVTHMHKYDDSTCVKDVTPKFMENQQLKVGIFVANKLKNNISPEFVHKLIQVEKDWLVYFLKVIHAHLEQRSSEGVKITQHVNVKILAAEIIACISELDLLLRQQNYDYFFCQKLIYQACTKLAKLAGGRAFITGSVLKMLCTFNLINSIYLTQRGI